jgi:hypothetical protein
MSSFGIVQVNSVNANVTYKNASTVYIAGAPTGGNNVTLTGNTYAFEVASGKSWFGGDIEFHSANGVTFFDGTNQTTAAAPYAYSTAAFNTANSAVATTVYLQGVDNTQNTNITAVNNYAQSGYAQANAATNSAQAAFDKANSANVLAQSAYDSSNTANSYLQTYTNTVVSANLIAAKSYTDTVVNANVSIIAGVNNYQNTYITNVEQYAESGYAQANTNAGNISVIQSVNVGQNTYISHVEQYAQSGYAQANTNAGNISVIQGVDLGQNTYISHVEQYAQSGYNLANSNFFQIGAIQGVNLSQNTYISNVEQYSQSAYAKANTNATNISIIQGVDLGQNTKITNVESYAQSGYAQANAANNMAQAAYNTANTNATNITNVQGYAQSGYATANSASANTVYTQGVDAGQNTFITNVQSYAQSAYDSGNTNGNRITNVQGYAQSGYATANSAVANTVYTQGVDAGQNTFITNVQSYAQSGYATANSALTRANSSLNANTGGTVTGDVSITGNLTVSGTQTIVNTTTLQTNDSLIELAANNVVGDVLDIGFYGASNNGTAVVYSGLVRQAGTNNFLLFKGLTNNPTGNTLSPGSATPANVGTLIANVAGYTITSNGVDLYAYTTNVQGYAQSSYAQANATNSFAQGAYNKANNSVQTVGAAGPLSSSGGTSPTISLNTSGVATGTYGGSSNIPVITVDTYGRITSAANTTISIPAGTTIYANSGQLTANASTGNVALGLATTGVSAGTYANGSFVPVITVDAYGRITAISNTAISASGAYTRTSYTATLNQTTFNATYTPGYVQVYVNGVLLNANDYVATNGTSIVLNTPSNAGSIVEIISLTISNVNSSSYVRTTFTATASQTTFNVVYTVGYVQVYINGILQMSTDYTATNGTSIVLTTPASLNDIVEIIALSPIGIANAQLANNIFGGTTGSLPYQSGVNTTSFLGIGASGTVLTSTGSTINWSNSVNNANFANTASVANNVSGGTANSLVYQSAANTTAFSGSGVTFVNNANTLNLTGTSSAQALKLTNATESITTNNTAISANTNFYVNNGSVQYWTANAGSNTVLNITFSAGTTLNSVMANNDSLSIAAMITNGATAYYPTGYQIDGVYVTPKWQANSAPTGGDANSIDVYGLTIIKTNTNTYTVLASQSQFK